MARTSLKPECSGGLYADDVNQAKGPVLLFSSSFMYARTTYTAIMWMMSIERWRVFCTQFSFSPLDHRFSSTFPVQLLGLLPSLFERSYVTTP